MKFVLMKLVQRLTGGQTFDWPPQEPMQSTLIYGGYPRGMMMLPKPPVSRATVS